MQFTPFASDIELPFYSSLASLKINHDKLDDSARKLLGLYEIRSSDALEASCRMQIRGNALTSDDVPTGYYRAEGIIKNVNTVEEYKNTDKNALLHQAGKTVWDAIKDGSIHSCPSLLSSFIVLSFADLKTYKFSYWFAFPAIHSDPPWSPVLGTGEEAVGNKAGPGSSELEDSGGWVNIESATLVDAVQTWRYGVDARQHGFFLARRDWHPSSQQTSPNAFSWNIEALSGFETGFFDGSKPEDRFVCFADPSNYPKAPGWMLRNLLVLIRERWSLDTVQILRYRDVQSRREMGRSSVLTLKSEPRPSQSTVTGLKPGDDMPKVTGWERNITGKLTGRTANLAEYMDPQRLADQSVDLNLKLMKWRISPNLDLDKIKNTKCLLLGAGTLGSYVARNLMGWGVRKITFVDSGTVSFSNPVRQPLFNFNDCLGGGSKKAHRASQALSEIYPGVESSGHVLSVPMAGHPITDEAATHKDFELLKDLIDNHDAIFLLMDTRESRWLPTVMAKAAGKIVMNAALGFDTYVVMRHGQRNISKPESELGCYFCNDVVAPADSMKDQTLDQQCTVTRPGVAPIASALLVEMLVSIIQHPQGAAAPASVGREESQGDHPLGIVPHQIRGFLSNFSNMLVVGKSYSCCSACSDTIVSAYNKDGWDFVRKALNERGYVEELSGLKEVQRIAEEAAAEIEWEEDTDPEDVDAEGEIV
ncbi:Autophagy protein 7 [Arachnomyces sp. PD_36]|nr:Autophagy protein 7 [Arachnomyces sp. PD_36]